MKLVFYSIVLNHHQVPVADAFYEILGDDYCFVETVDLKDNKGSKEDFSQRPYLLKAWKSDEDYGKAMELARTAECCVFSGIQALPFQRVRMKLGLLSFDMSERWLKRGVINVFSPAIFKMLFAYYWGRWYKKPIYKLCCSAFAAKDQRLLGTYRGKCYKWGYFTKVEKFDFEASRDVSISNIATLMWCSRYLILKHPEMPVLMAERLKSKGYRFRLDMYGSGEHENRTRQLAQELGVEDVVSFHGDIPNNELMSDMRRHSIFIFTSDRNEGWGAVANESMSNGCVLVASEDIGSTPYLVKEGFNGFSFKTGDVDSLTQKIIWLLDHPNDLSQMKVNAIQTMAMTWNPQNAARSLLKLIDDLKNNRESSISDGPCSIA